MDCEQALALLSAELDREAQTGDSALLAAHLETCPACREAALAQRLQDADLRRAFSARRRAVATVTDRVLASLPTQPPPAKRRLQWFPLTMSAAAPTYDTATTFPGAQVHIIPATLLVAESETFAHELDQIIDK